MIHVRGIREIRINVEFRSNRYEENGKDNNQMTDRSEKKLPSLNRAKHGTRKSHHVSEIFVPLCSRHHNFRVVVYNNQRETKISRTILALQNQTEKFERTIVTGRNTLSNDDQAN